MARGHRKLGRPTDQRKALLKNQVTNLFYHGKITTTVTRAKEIRKIAEKLITIAVKERDNFTEVQIEAKTPRKDVNGRRVKEVVDGKKITVFDTVTKTIKKDNPSRLTARRRLISSLYPVTSAPLDGRKKKQNTKKVDLAAKLLNDVAPKYADRNGGYTRMVKIGPRKGDGAEQVILELI